jgi:pimeloyl-ACP methyl ester carboxylesterase
MQTIKPAIRQSLSPQGATVYWPARNRPRGGVVCLHGSEGGTAGWNDVTCALFAASGFVALAHAYTRSAALERPDIDNVPLDATETALSWLRDELAPHGCGIGLFGGSRGAEHALLLAELLAETDSPAMPDAVAVHSPPDAVWPAFIVADFQTGKPWAGDRMRPAWSWRGAHRRVFPGTLLRPEWFPGPVFIAQGADDRVWGAEMARRLVERMRVAGRPAEAHFFEGEGHVFGADARNREWELLLRFFGRHLAVSSR